MWLLIVYYAQNYVHVTCGCLALLRSNNLCLYFITPFASKRSAYNKTLVRYASRITRIVICLQLLTLSVHTLFISFVDFSCLMFVVFGPVVVCWKYKKKLKSDRFKTLSKTLNVLVTVNWMKSCRLSLSKSCFGNRVV